MDNKIIEVPITDLDASAHVLDCQIDNLKAEISDEYLNDEKLELLIEKAMKLGEIYARRDFTKEKEGAVLVQSQGLILTCGEILEALEFGAPDLKIERTEYSENQMNTEITLVHRESGHSGAGFYAYCTECPEEGEIKLGSDGSKNIGKRNLSKAMTDILNERERQKSQEGYSHEHDDQYEHNELSRAAASYVDYAANCSSLYESHPSLYQRQAPPNNWVFDKVFWKPKKPRQDLIRAAALIIAEVERMDRKVINGGDQNGL